MKIFRKKLWSTLIKETGLIVAMILIIPYSVLFIYVKGCTPIIIMVISGSFIGVVTFKLLVATIAHMNYLIIDDEKIVLQNGGFRFMRKEWHFDQIKQVNVVCMSNIEHIQVVTEKKKTFRYALRLVNTKDFYEIISIIKKKGVLGSTEGMEKYL